MRFLQAAHVSAGSNTPVTRVVIHSTVSACAPGGAWATANYFASSSSGGSAHYIVDPGEEVGSVRENQIAWHAPPNGRSIGIEMCDMCSMDVSRWKDANHQAVLARAAALTRDVCLRNGVPLRRLTVEQVRAGERGICGHVDVSAAFHQTDHWDPGAFPWDQFMQQVGGEAPPSTLTPTRHPSEVTDMIVGQDQSNGDIYLISGNTRLQFPGGGGDQYPGGSLYAAVLLDMLRQAYPDNPPPRLVALNHDIVSRLPDVYTLIAATGIVAAKALGVVTPDEINALGVIPGLLDQIAPGHDQLAEGNLSGEDAAASLAASSDVEQAST